MQRINIKPLSVNECFQGRRFRTPKYKTYQKELTLLLRSVNVPKGRLQLVVTFGLSSKNADWDNPIKAFQDIVSKKYGFNDRHIYKGIVEKVDVAKGSEFIEFELTEYTPKK